MAGKLTAADFEDAAPPSGKPAPADGSLDPGASAAIIDEDDWSQRLKAAIASGHLDPELPDGAEILRDWARFVVCLDPLERELRISEKLAVLSGLHQNAQAVVDAALAGAEQERGAQGNGKPDAPRILTAPEFAELAAEQIDYLVWGYVARGMVTQLAAGIKVGKTVFIMDAVRAMLTGDEFLGHATQRCPVLYLTEEGRTSFRRNLDRAQLLERKDLHLLLRQEVHGMKWDDVGALVMEHIERRHVGLVIVDTLSDWANLASDGEKDEAAARRSVSVMRDWCNASGCAAVALQHERKAGGGVGESARGSTAFGGAMDILLTLQESPKERERERHPDYRILSGRGRCDVPDPVVVSFDRTDHHYSLVGGLTQTKQQAVERSIVDCLPYAISDDIDIDYICEQSGAPRTTVRRALDGLIARQVVTCAKVHRSTGTGMRNVFWIGVNDER